MVKRGGQRERLATLVMLPNRVCAQMFTVKKGLCIPFT